MQEFETLLPDVLVRAPACPEPTAINAIRDAVTELCERNRAWRVDNCYTLTCGQPEFLMTPADALLVEIDSITHHGRPLRPLTLEDAQRRQWSHTEGAVTEWWQQSGQPAFYTQRQPNQILVLPHEGGETIRVSAFMKPGPYSEEAPDWLMREYRLALRDGALSRILDIPGQEFSNLQRAAVYASAWQAALAQSSTKWVQGQQRAPLRTRARFM